MPHFLDHLDRSSDIIYVSDERVDQLTSEIGAQFDRIEAARPAEFGESIIIDGRYVQVADPRDSRGKDHVDIRAGVRITRMDDRTAFVHLFGRSALGEAVRFGYYLEHGADRLVEIRHGEFSGRPDMRHPETEHFLMLASAALEACQ